MQDSELIRVLEEDIEGLKNLVKMYSNERKFSKASDCMVELEELTNKLAEELAKPTREVEHEIN